MQEMARIHKFDPVIYPRKLWVVLTDDSSVLKENFENIDGESPDGYEGFEDNRAITFRCSRKETSDYGVCVCFRRREFLNEIKTIAHESLHVATAIMKDCNISMGYNIGQDESCAYLVGWAADCINRVRTNKL